MRIHHMGQSDTGRRDNNEDAYIAAPELGFFAVADGMGGYEGGEVASQLALETLVAYFERLGDDLDLERQDAVDQMRMAVRMADREVGRRAIGELSEMGTTVACMVVRGEHAILAHVGDSRIYRLRDGELQTLTRDHSLVAEMEAAGLGATAHLGHIITQCLGQGPSARPDIAIVTVMPGDRFLLSSDGLHDVLTSEEIASELSRPRDAAEALVDAAYNLGSYDNITAVVVAAD